MIVFHHSKCRVVRTGISTHDAVIMVLPSVRWSDVWGQSDNCQPAERKVPHCSLQNNKRMYVMRSPLCRWDGHFIHGGLARSDM